MSPGNYGQAAAGVNSNPANGGNGINMFRNPDQVYKELRPCVLGFDISSCGNGGNLRGMPFFNLDMTISKDLGIWKEKLGATLIFQISNVLNHTQLGDPYLDISESVGFRRAGYATTRITEAMDQPAAPDAVRSLAHPLLEGR